jgi:hypothetical protein
MSCNLQKPEGLTKFGRTDYLLTKLFCFNGLLPVADGQFSPAGSGQGLWLFHITTVFLI